MRKYALQFSIIFSCSLQTDDRNILRATKLTLLRLGSYFVCIGSIPLL